VSESTTRGPLPEEFPTCGHRIQSLGFWDGQDAKTGRRTGGRLRCYHCDLAEGLEGIATPEKCRACRELPSQGTFDALSAEIIEAAVRRYCQAFDLWPKGVRSEASPWAQALGALKDEVRKRGDELQAQGAFVAGEREDYFSGAALTRGMILGWCLCEAAKAAEGGAA